MNSKINILQNGLFQLAAWMLWMTCFFDPAFASNQINSDFLQSVDHIVLRGTIRDFMDTHPDFENDNATSGLYPGNVLPDLSDDGKPVLNPDTTVPSITSAETFNQWFRDVPDVNQSVSYEIILQRSENSTENTPLYTYENNVFFPIDGLLFGNQGRVHNYHFTYELHSQFTYTGPQILRFISDDDLYVFINKKLAIDLGGIHSREEQAVNTGDFSLVIGQTYPLDIFFAERHTTESYLKIQTGIELQNSEPIVEPAAVRTFSQQQFRVNEAIGVTIAVINSGILSQTWTVQEQLPLGWSAREISHNGTMNNNTITWTLTAPPDTTSLSYTAVAPALPLRDAQWQGTVEDTPITGEDQINIIYPGIGMFNGHLDIGQPGNPGGANQIGYNWTVTGSGQGAGYDSDHFHYLFKEVQGDFRFIINNPTILSDSDDDISRLLARMGIMVRSSLEPSAPFVFAHVQSLNQTVGLSWRSVSGSTAQEEENGLYTSLLDPRSRLCLQRSGDCFIVSTMDARGQETIYSAQSVSMPNAVYVGIAVTSSHTGELAIGRFSEPVFIPISHSQVYQNTFEDSVGKEWSINSIDQTPLGNRRFLGQFGNQTVTLNLASLPAHTDLILCFDLFAIRSWDGNNNTSSLGPDLWTLSAQNSLSLLHTTFTNSNGLYQNSYQAEDGIFHQSFPRNYPEGDYSGHQGSVENNSLGYLYNDEAMDSVYRICKVWTNNGETAQFNFSAEGLQDLADESWGIDNVTVYTFTRQQPVLPTPTPTETQSETPSAEPFQLTGIIRDFQDIHPDFEHFTGSVVDPNIVLSHLNSQQKPVYNDFTSHDTVSGKTYFDQWFNDVPGVNQSKLYTITLSRFSDDAAGQSTQSETAIQIPQVYPETFAATPETPHSVPNAEEILYLFDGTDFFPIDNELFGNQDRDHNYHFTYELHAFFRYEHSAELTVISDDDLWVFINGNLVIDLGGAHPERSETINIGELGLDSGSTYALDIFYAERHTNHARFSLQSGVRLTQQELPPDPTPTVTSTRTPSVKPTSRPTATPTVTPKPTATSKPTKTPKPTNTPKPTATPTTTATPTPTKNPSSPFTIGGGEFSITSQNIIEVPIDVQNLPSAKAITFDVVYDKNILTFTRSFSTQDTLIEKWKSVDANAISANRIRVGAAAFTADAVQGSGTLITLKFEINTTANSYTTTNTGASTTLRLDNLRDGVKNAGALPITLLLGKKGDVDANGKITANDAQVAFKISVARLSPTSYQEWAAEVTGDNQITAADAQTIFEASLGRIQLNSIQPERNQNSSLRTLGLMNAATQLTIGSQRATSGEEILVPIEVENPSSITAMMMDISYDTHKLSFQGIETENTLLRDFGMADSYEKIPGSVRIGAVAFASDPVTISGTLVLLRFQVDPKASGRTSIMIESTEDDLAGASTVRGSITIHKNSSSVHASSES